MSEQKLIFVTGKGGVGKSTVALSIAKKYSTNKKVLLVELGVRSFFADSLKISVDYKPVRIQNNLDVALWSGSECLKEYAIYLLKIESLYNLFFENRISRALIDVAPALSELAILGKITSGVRNIGPSLNYDILVIDCYATGHMLALLRAPRGIAEAIKFGPMAEQTSTMLKTIKNSKICEFVIVTLPEELPAIEADELFHEIFEEVGVTPILICNKVWPRIPEKNINNKNALTEAPEEKNFRQRVVEIINRQQSWISYLIVRHPTMSQLPMIFSSDPNEITNSMENLLL